jgi:hypothetical protein
MQLSLEALGLSIKSIKSVGEEADLLHSQNIKELNTDARELQLHI